MSNIGEKVNNIYTAIENENYDGAIRMADKPDLRNYPLPQALLAYCYACKGGPHMQLALDQCRLVMKMRPNDESTLNALDITMKKLRKDEELVPFYEALCLSYPDNSEMKHKLFGMHISQGDGKKMQLLAQKLYKQYGDKKYVFWTVGCMLQQHDLPPMMLTVAERMLAKVFYDAAAASAALACNTKASVAEAARLAVVAKAATINQPGAEELELYVEVLKRMNKRVEALEKLRELYARPAGPPINNGQQFQADGSCVKMHKLRYQTLCTALLSSLVEAETDVANCAALKGELKALQTDILKDYPDQWSAHQLLIALEATGTCTVDTSDKTKRCLTDAAVLTKHRDYLKGLQQSMSYLRGPYLAEIELLSAWGASGRRQELPSSWELSKPPEGYSVDEGSAEVDMAASSFSASVRSEMSVLLCRYLRKFQSKQCCFSDLKGYLSLLSKSALGAIDFWAQAQRMCLEKELELAAARVSADTEAVAVEKTAEVATGTVDKKKKKKDKGRGGSNNNRISNSNISEESGTVASAKHSAGDKARNKAVVLLCSHSKMCQVSAYAAFLSTGTAIPESPSLPEEQERSMELFDLTRPLCLGSIGGEKEVQPGDEMLLLTSVRHRAALALRSSAGAGKFGLDAVRFAAYARWLFMLEHGNQASPYSYAFKVDGFDAWRALACGSQVQKHFEALKVRHVQNDSLSYLVLPSLVEAGLFGEAKKQHFEVIRFHRAAVKDTAEMISESFKHANYSKGLEMKRFLGKCTNSLQLALTNAEFPLLHIVEPTSTQKMTLTQAAEYLEEYVANDAQPVHDTAALAALQDNNDYSLLVRCDSTLAQEDTDRVLRRGQIEERIRKAQLCVRMLSSAINAEPEAAQGHLDALMAVVEARPNTDVSVSAKDIELEGAGGQGGATTTVGTSASQWDQELRCGGASFEKAVWEATRNVVNLSLSAARTIQASLGISPQTALAPGLGSAALTPENYTVALQQNSQKTESLVSGCTASLGAVQELLLSSQTHLTASDGGETGLLHPEWVQRVSAFSRTLAPWASLLLAAAQASLPADAEDFKAKTGSRDANCEGSSSSGSSSSNISGSGLSYDDISSPLLVVSAAMLAVVQKLKVVVDGTTTLLLAHEDAALSAISSSSDGKLAQHELVLQVCQPAGKNVSQEVQKAVARKLLADQSASVQSLRGVLEGLW